MTPEISPHLAHAKRRPNLMHIALYLGILALLPVFMLMGYAIAGSGEPTSSAEATPVNIDTAAAEFPDSSSEPIATATVTPESNVQATEPTTAAQINSGAAGVATAVSPVELDVSDSGMLESKVETSLAPTDPVGAYLSISALPSIADLVEQVMPAVVSVEVETIVRGFFGSRRVRGSGSGVIFSEDGYIITNNHVVANAISIQVTLADGRDMKAELIGTHGDSDLAVIRVEAQGLFAAPLEDDAELRVGDWVVAIGNALGLPGGHTVTLGVVSALGRSLPTGEVTLTDLIQTDAVINPGNSGGPLINLEGHVVGINTAILRGDSVDGIGFAVGMGTAIPVIQQLI